MMRRLSFALLGFFLFLVMGIPLAALLLLGSESGTRWTIDQAQRHAPGELRIAASSGTLLGTLELRQVVYQNPPYRVAIDSLLLSWEPGALLRWQVHIERFIVSGLRYQGPQAAEEKSDGLPEIHVPLGVVIDEALLEQAEIKQGDEVRSIQQARLQAKADKEKLTLESLQVKVQPLQFQASGQAQLAPFYPFTVQLNWQLDMPEGKPIVGAGRLSGNLQRIEIEHAVTEPFRLTSQGVVALTEKAPPRFAIEGEWRGLHWPLSEAPDYTSASGRYHAAGQPEDYALTAEGVIAGKAIPSAELSLKSRGDLQHLEVKSLKAQTLEGVLNAHGEVAWAPQPAWQIALEAEHINPAQLAPEWPGQLSLKSRLQGRIKDEAMEATVVIEKLEGQLRQWPVAGSGSLALQDEHLRVKDLKLRSGPNRLSAEGFMEQALDLQFKLDAPELAGLWPGLKGRLQGAGRIGGLRQEPRLTLALSGAQIGYEAYQIAALDLDLHFDPADAKRSKAAFTARQIHLGAHTIAAVSLQAKGGVEKHRGLLQAESSLGNLEMSLSGGYRAETWRGKLEKLNVSLPPTGEWQLAQPVAIKAAVPAHKRAVSVEQLCLIQEDAKLCAQGDWRAADGLAAQGRLEALPLALAQPYLPQDMALQGVLDGHFQIDQRQGKTAAQAEVLPRPGRLVFSPEGAEPIRAAYENARLAADYSADRLALRFQLAFPDYGHAEGRFTAALAEQPSALEGHVEAQVPDLKLLSALTPALQEVRGSLRLNADLGGTLQAPALQGRVDLRRAGAKVPELGIEVQAVALTVRNQGLNRLVLGGQASSGGGLIRLDGAVDLPDQAGWDAELSIRGKNFQAARLPEAQVWISPDLNFRYRDNQANLSGTVLIPKAVLEIKKLPETAVAVSEDEIIVNEPAAQREKVAEKFNLRSRVELILGDEVSFKGYGLKTRLAGAMEISSFKGQTSAHGTVKLEEGRYEAYGQDLTIEQGKFTFSGPVDNPLLDVRATRTIKRDQIVAVLSLTGPLKSPQTQVFTEPSTSEANALAYLLTGRPLGRASESEENLIANAALSFGLKYAQGIAQGLGLDELAVKKGETLEESALLLGKYLTPDLYVGYAFDFFGSQGAFSLSYQLTERFTIETQAGRSQSVDLLYKIETE